MKFQDVKPGMLVTTQSKSYRTLKMQAELGLYFVVAVTKAPSDGPNLKGVAIVSDLMTHSLNEINVRNLCEVTGIMIDNVTKHTLNKNRNSLKEFMNNAAEKHYAREVNQTLGDNISVTKRVDTSVSYGRSVNDLKIIAEEVRLIREGLLDAL